MKLTNILGYWTCEFTNHKGDKQQVTHPDRLTAMQVAFINKLHGFLS